MKKLLVLILIILMTVPAFSTVILINNKKADFSVIDLKENNIVFVPLRDLEAMGYGVISLGENGSVEFSTNRISMLFFKNSNKVKMNALDLTLPMNTYMMNGKFMVPLSFIVKSLGGEYKNAEELVINITDMPADQKLEAPKLENKAAEKKPETPKTITQEVTESQNVIEDFQNKNVGINWFQGIIMAYGKKLNLIDIDLYSAADNKCIQTVQSSNGSFVFVNVDNGPYYIKIDHKKNPSFKNFRTDVFQVKDWAGKRFDAPIVIARAIKSGGIKPIKINNQTCFSLTWSEVPNAANYKVTVTSANPKAKIAKYDKKETKINIPISDLSKGQTYGVKIEAFDKVGNKIGESSDSGWSFSTL